MGQYSVHILYHTYNTSDIWDSTVYTYCTILTSYMLTLLVQNMPYLFLIYILSDFKNVWMS